MKYKIVGLHPMDAYCNEVRLIGTIITSDTLFPNNIPECAGYMAGEHIQHDGHEGFFFAVKVELVKSPWFPADVNPVHVGVYERDYGALLSPLVNKPEYQYWDGTKWYYGSRDVDETYQLSAQKHVDTYPSAWRGVEK